MSKYISIFFLFEIVSVLLFFIFGSVFIGGGNPAEEAVYTFGTIIVLFLSFIISQMCYLIDLIKKNGNSMSYSPLFKRDRLPKFIKRMLKVKCKRVRSMLDIRIISFESFLPGNI